MLKRAFTLLVMAGMAASIASAAENPFIGNWKMNSSKSRTPDEMKVASKGGNTWSFDFGGTPEIIAVDGTDQPGIAGTTLSVKPDAPDTWIVERKKDGKLLLRATWKLANDGSTLTDYYREFEPDGSTLSMDYVYQRHGGGSGFAADWQSIRETRNTPLNLRVTAYQGDGLSFITSPGSVTQNARLDGKDYPNPGPNARSSSAIVQVDEQTLQMTDKYGGIVRDTREFKLSPDGKSLTMTVHVQGRTATDVLVFDRE